MDKSLVDQSLDKLFEGLSVDEANAAATVRCLVELAYFETRARHLSKLGPTAFSRLKQCVAPQAPELPNTWHKMANDELSRFGRNIAKVKETEFKYWHQDGITPASLPFSILCKETKRRIFRFFADPLKNQIQWARQSGMVDAKRQETYYDILRTLAHHCDSVDCLTEDDVVESLKASIASVKSKCNALKEQLQQLAPSDDDSVLVNKLKRAHAEAAQLSGQLQTQLHRRMT